MSEERKPEIKQEPEAVAFADFLESIPPSTLTSISVLGEHKRNSVTYYILTPELQLHCPDDACNGTRFFRYADSDEHALYDTFSFLYLTYRCSNCRKTTKTFSLAARVGPDASSGECYKFGELPAYGPPTSSRLITLIGPDREIFLKGRRCENQGHGIGAFVYYRRVVERQKNRILDNIIRVAKKLNAEPDLIATLEAAKTETQFRNALASVKNAMPEALLINGHNPLTLLHSALSEGLHEESDEHCLQIASSVRILLAELSERLAQALKDEAELNSALTTLMRKKNSK